MRNFFWLLVMPFLLFGLALYLLVGFIYESVWGENRDMRLPFERVNSYEELVDRQLLT